MRNLATSILIGAGLVGYQASKPQAPAGHHAEGASQAAADTYEHLATAIIAIEATEDELVKSILIGYETAAQGHLAAATRDAQGRVGHLESAAAEITNIANEGDKKIQAIRQRLAKAGHTHNTDAETKGDYLFVTNREKKGLLDLASKVGRAGADTGEIKTLGDELTKLFGAAIAPE
ncbi:hypothetical protein EP7_000882 [Isosphaeraceae bacterium EP7]